MFGKWSLLFLIVAVGEKAALPYHTAFNPNLATNNCNIFFPGISLTAGILKMMHNKLNEMVSTQNDQGLQLLYCLLKIKKITRQSFWAAILKTAIWELLSQQNCILKFYAHNIINLET